MVNGVHELGYSYLSHPAALGRLSELLPLLLPTVLTWLGSFSFFQKTNTEWTGKYLNCNLPNFRPEETSKIRTRRLLTSVNEKLV